MRKLIRGDGPHCLSLYRHGLHRWSLESPTPPERVRIWEHLRAMQDTRCAYCETDISKHSNAHIEHFRQRERYRQGTFEWSNLFGSCKREKSCGHFKDQCRPYDHTALIKPDEDDPDDYFIFVSDGTIVPRAGLNDRLLYRATETLRIFNLDADNGALREMRREAARRYLDTAETLYQLFLENPDSDFQQFLEEEIQQTAHLPFATAIRHTLSA